MAIYEYSAPATLEAHGDPPEARSAPWGIQEVELIENKQAFGSDQSFYSRRDIARGRRCETTDDGYQRGVRHHPSTGILDDRDRRNTRL